MTKEQRRQRRREIRAQAERPQPAVEYTSTVQQAPPPLKLKGVNVKA